MPCQHLNTRSDRPALIPGLVDVREPLQLRIGTLLHRHHIGPIHGHQLLHESVFFLQIAGEIWGVKNAVFNIANPQLKVEKIADF